MGRHCFTESRKFQSKYGNGPSKYHRHEFLRRFGHQRCFKRMFTIVSAFVYDQFINAHVDLEPIAEYDENRRSVGNDQRKDDQKLETTDETNSTERRPIVEIYLSTLPTNDTSQFTSIELIY